MTVRELLARIDSRELSEWSAYFGLEPWGTEVEDWRAGLVASTIANANRDPKRQKKPYQPKDFMPQRVPPKEEEQSWEDQAKILEMWARTMETQKGGLR